jgi:acyl carrier protein
VSLSRQDLVDFFTTHFELDRAGLADDLPLFSSSLLDSTSMITLVTFLEEKTGLTIEADDLTLEHFDTIAAILSFCAARAS